MTKVNQEQPTLNALILMGGVSSRMGSTKALLKHPDGSYLIQRAVNLFQFIPSQHIYISLRQEQQSLLPKLRSDVRVIHDSYEDIGPAAGLLSAYKEDPTSHWVIFAVDFASATPDSMSTLIDTHLQHSNPITCYIHPDDGQPEPFFAVWSPQALEEFRINVEENKRTEPIFTLKQVLKKTRLDTNDGEGAYIKPMDSSWLIDTNTPDEWFAMQKRAEKATALKYDDALDLIREAAKQRTKILTKDDPSFMTERVPVEESVGRISSKDISATSSLPAFDKSAVDGFALSASSTIGASTKYPIEFNVVGTLFYGDAPPNVGSLSVKNPCYQVTVGAPFPGGTAGLFDCCVNTEDVEVVRDEEGRIGKVKVTKVIAEGNNRRLAGDDYVVDDLVLRKAEVVRAEHLYVLIALGIDEVEVSKRVTVVIVSIGDELWEDEHQTPKVGQVGDSNSPYSKLRSSICVPEHG